MQKVYIKKIMENSSAPTRSRCDWLEVSLSLGSLRELESSSWFKNIKNQGNPEWSKDGKKWTLNGHMLFWKTPSTENSPFSNFEGRVTATGRLADELLELLSECQKMSNTPSGPSGPSGEVGSASVEELPLPFKVRRLDIKTEIEIPTGIKNWENIRKRQAAEESKKMQFARKVQLIISNDGSTLAIGTRGRSKTYCRLEVRTTSVSLELEYRHEKASKIGKTLLKSENPSSQMNFYLKEYLQSLVPIQKITRPLLTKLSVNTGAPCRLPREKVDVKGEASKKKEYCETVIFPFLRKMLENPKMKDWLRMQLLLLLKD